MKHTQDEIRKKIGLILEDFDEFRERDMEISINAIMKIITDQEREIIDEFPRRLRGISLRIKEMMEREIEAIKRPTT